jgi:RNA 2',3'-cyclic 3'-phosphodiesterase
MPIADLPRPSPARSRHDVRPQGMFLPAEPGRGDAIFFAVRPPPSTAACISRLARDSRDRHRLTGRPLPTDCFHISLLFVGYHGRLPEVAYRAIDEAVATIAMPPFRVRFDWVESFNQKQNRPLVLRGDDGVSGLLRLRDKLIATTLDIPGCAPARREFTPHLTLLYDERAVPEEPIEDISWLVSEFALIRSLYGQARHIVRRRWTLRG